MHGFGSFDSAARFCSAVDELRNYLRSGSTMGEPTSPLERRQAFLDRLTAMKKAMQAAS
jgi:putative transposase